MTPKEVRQIRRDLNEAFAAWRTWAGSFDPDVIDEERAYIEAARKRALAAFRELTKTTNPVTHPR